MVPSSLVIPYTGRLPADWLEASLPPWIEAGVTKVIVAGPADSARIREGHVRVVRISTGQPFSGEVWREISDETAGVVLLCVNGDANVSIGPAGIGRLTSTLAETGSSLVYANYLEQTAEELAEHSTIDYQLGSVRDAFDFGPVIALSKDAVREAESRWGPLSDTRFGGLYELRLRISLISPPLRVPEALYTCRQLDNRPSGAQQFDYVDPRNRGAQLEMERLVTEHLDRLGARLPARFTPVPLRTEAFPVEASVVIPVRNREQTIGDAVRSALQQDTSFDYNVIVVDNHSTDGTTATLKRLSAEDPRLVHLVPESKDLQIGGCWNLAVNSPPCGRIAVQLDSDDLYAGPDTLQQIADCMSQGLYAMVVGSYRIVDFRLQEIPPGLIDHREWTRQNGRTNLLRVNGLGAPRAYDTHILRQHPFPNVSYGEDYAMGLRLSREYEIGRIFEPLYLCRRWEGNSDADLAPAARNRHDTYKDRLRTMEILARSQMNLHDKGNT